ncbi:MAG: hypothetical protein DCC67_02105 [Planctomycetota bacterium]|nr:MAG: hypothetical protein DCC67_02105 [Planctomycetota bacterium]
MNDSIDPGFLSAFSSLTPAQQAELMGYLSALKGTPRGTPGRDLLQFVGTIPKEDLIAMLTAIDADCEQVDRDAW